MKADPARAARGFTLLEVLVALTITGFALGALLGVIGGNKRLAWRSEAALLDASRVRVELAFVQLDNGRGELPRPDAPSALRIDNDIIIEPPERKTVGVNDILRSYEIVDADGVVITRGVHWAHVAVPE